jgi:multicomponent Na+:H+ antiporter subunit G
MLELDTMINFLSWVFLSLGSLSVVIGAYGTVKFPDFWSRLQAASVTDSAGMILIMSGLCLQAGLTLITVKIIIIMVFLFITGPTSTHALANAALVSGLLPKTKDTTQSKN